MRTFIANASRTGRGMEAELLPVADKARSILARVQA